MSVETNEIAFAVTNLDAFSPVKKSIDALVLRHKDIVIDTTTTKGLKDALEGRKEVREARLDIEERRKTAKAPLLDAGKKLDDEAKKLTAILEPLEARYDVEIKKEEKRKAEEKAKKEREERERVEAKKKRIEAEKKAIEEERKKIEEEKKKIEEEKKKLEEAKAVTKPEIPQGMKINLIGNSSEITIKEVEKTNIANELEEIGKEVEIANILKELGANEIAVPEESAQKKEARAIFIETTKANKSMARELMIKSGEELLQAFLEKYSELKEFEEVIESIEEYFEEC